MTPAFSIVIMLALLLLILGGLLLGIILWITGGKGGTKSEMSCGGCGYAVRGLEALNCPECGADLRQVGIQKGQSGGKRGLGIALTVGTSLLLLLMCLSSMFFLARNPSGPVQSMPAQTHPSSVHQPGSTPPAAGVDEPEAENVEADR